MVETRAEAFKMLHEHFPKDAEIIKELEVQCSNCIRNTFDAKIKRFEREQEATRNDFVYWEYEKQIESAMFVLELFRDVKD